MRSSTKDKVRGKIKQAKGTIKEKAGRATKNPDLEERGANEKVGGTVQKKVGDIKRVFEK